MRYFPVDLHSEVIFVVIPSALALLEVGGKLKIPRLSFLHQEKGTII